MQIYAPGTHIGPYEIASNPMIGGRGVVYFCLDHANNDRPVALKTFKPEYLPDRAARDRFLREGTAWVQLGRHLHIVRCYEVEYIDPIAFLVLELIDKEPGRKDASLRSWMGRPIPLEQALLFALQIARGMKHATETIPGFVHRDLKPENILVGADNLPETNINRLRITDFGLATILDAGEKMKKDEEGLEALGHTHGIVGTPHYMAPEQWRGEPVGVHTDIYAFGCILYEMLTGQLAADGNIISELCVIHCTGKLRSLPDNLSRDLGDLLTRSLSLSLGERYQNWAEVINKVEQVYKAYGFGNMPDEINMQNQSLYEHIQLGESYNLIGEAYRGLGKAQVAVTFFEKALVIAQETGNQLGLGNALGGLGTAYMNLGDLMRAIRYYEQCLDIHRKIGHRHAESLTLGNLGMAYLIMGDARRALQYHQEKLVIIQEIGDLADQGTTLGNLGNAYAALGNIQQAIHCYEQHLEISRQVNDRRGQGNALGNLGIAYKNLGDIPRAIAYCEQQLLITNEIGDRIGESNAYGSLGRAYEKTGDLSTALIYFERKLIITREIGDRHGEGTALADLGTVSGQLGAIEKAIEYCQQAIAIRSEIDDLPGLASTFSWIGIFHWQRGELQLALEYEQESARISTQIGNIPNAQHAEQLIRHMQSNGPV